MTSNQTPVGTECIGARYYAAAIAENMHTVYWLECGENNESSAQHLRQEAWKHLEKLVALFGAELVEIEPEQEPEPLDAETVAVREAMTEQHIANAGRGHLVRQ